MVAKTANGCEDHFVAGLSRKLVCETCEKVTFAILLFFKYCTVAVYRWNLPRVFFMYSSLQSPLYLDSFRRDHIIATAHLSQSSLKFCSPENCILCLFVYHQFNWLWGPRLSTNNQQSSTNTRINTNICSILVFGAKFVCLFELSLVEARRKPLN